MASTDGSAEGFDLRRERRPVATATNPARLSVVGNDDGGDDPTARFVAQALPYRAQLYGTARRMTANHFDAEDLVQETILKAYIAFRSFRDGTNLRAWLFRIMYNTWVSDYRARARRPCEVMVDDFKDWQLVEHSEHAPAGLRSAEAEALDAMRDDDMADALEQLPRDNQMIVYFADVAGFKYREVAALMDIPVGTVMSRLSRSRSRLRELLAEVALDRGVHRSATAVKALEPHHTRTQSTSMSAG
jgi:RNA polymerase sigma-70 factor (ECF subfamily)